MSFWHIFQLPLTGLHIGEILDTLRIFIYLFIYFCLWRGLHLCNYNSLTRGFWYLVFCDCFLESFIIIVDVTVFSSTNEMQQEYGIAIKM